VADAETTATNTSEAAIARAAILMWVLPFALIREWFTGLSVVVVVSSVAQRSRRDLFPQNVAIVSFVLPPAACASHV
jgi:hypothetical protein